MITAIFLLGIGGLSAQSAWEVKVNWSLAGVDCDDPVSNNVGIIVGITIYDAANNNAIVCYDETNTESITATSSIFSSSQAGVYDYCNTYHDNTPSLTVIAVVHVVDIDEEIELCQGRKTEPGHPCGDFSTGFGITAVF